MIRKKKIIPVLFMVILLTASVLYFEVFRHDEEAEGRITGSGTIEVTEIEISSKIAGRVMDLPEMEGNSVKKGELLAKLEYDELKAQKLSATANLENTKKNLARIRDLFKSGSVSKQAYDNAETAYTITKAAYDQINAAIENAIIYSPISGTVLDTNLETGEMAFPGTPILTVADLTRPWMYIYVNEVKLGLVKLGQNAFIGIDSFPDRQYKGKVVAISNKAEFTPKTIQTKEERTKLVFAVKIAIENQDMSLKPGMPADAEILIMENQID
ncbi:MAG: efflux RND transporter periplasmic adaptor subunit [Spirochaetes bacterium]|nr:efflux RND transporter periplasmic adaptor subunit [Spirochaetota bacterium]